MKRAELYAAHFAGLADQHNVLVGRHHDGVAYRKIRSVCIRPIKTAITYAVAMHELGHILGPRQSGVRLDQEVGAWEWAHDNALEWTDAMEGTMQRSLRSYLRWSERRKGVRRAEAGHPIYVMIGRAT